jgi:hypothetical protein
MFDDLAALGSRFDLAVNTLSFSEMSEKQVRYYARRLKKLLGKRGVLFEQNQDNRCLGLIDCKEYLGDYFANRETLETTTMPGLTQGTADLWSNRRGKMRRPPVKTPESPRVEPPPVQEMRAAVPRSLQILRSLLGETTYERLRAHWHALRGR